ncbi:hypothetical protein J6590_018633 [Homalodisca vitripennis]|nr:hypothetical protein J6590_018633 [Homalodisca vitripennis]
MVVEWVVLSCMAWLCGASPGPSTSPSPPPALNIGCDIKLGLETVLWRPNQTQELLLPAMEDLHEYTSSPLQVQRKKKDSPTKTTRTGSNNAHPLSRSNQRLHD